MIGETRLRNIARSYCNRVGIGVPEVRESDWRQGWLIEDLIAGAMPDAPDFAAFLTTAYTDFLRQTARLRPIGRSAFARRAFQILIEDFGDQAGHLGVSDETLVPVGLAHNDTEASNVLRDWAGRFWLVDWEAAGPYPVCYDYARLFASNPAVGDELLACLRTFDDSGEAAQAELQLAAATAHIIRRNTPLAERAAPAIKALLRPRRR